MTTGLLLHPRTEQASAQFVADPSQSVLITGPPGSGKASLAHWLACQLFELSWEKLEQYEQHPQIRIIRSVDAKAIPIDLIRNLQHFLSLKVASGSQSSRLVQRLIVIEDAQLLTSEAQNALLKTLEEPPAHTALILTAPTLDAVLPTIRSRVQSLAVLAPSGQTILDYFARMGFARPSIEKSLQLSGGLAGLTAALLKHDSSHPLVVAADQARQLLQSKTYERLLLVDSMSKQKDACLHLCFILGRMARMALLRASDPWAIRRWKTVMEAVYVAERQLRRNTQAKLVLTNLMLTM